MTEPNASMAVTQSKPKKNVKNCGECGHRYRPKPHGAVRSQYCRLKCRVAAFRRRERSKRPEELERTILSLLRPTTHDPRLSAAILAAHGRFLVKQAKEKSEKPKKSRTKDLPWPRMGDDNTTPLGVDLKAKFEDIKKIIAKGRFKAKGIDDDDFLGELLLLIQRRNHMPSAYDPRKLTFGGYIYMIAKNLAINLSEKPLESLTTEGDYELEDTSDHLARFERLPREERMTAHDF